MRAFDVVTDLSDAAIARARAGVWEKVMRVALATRKERHEYAHQTAITGDADAHRKFQHQWEGADYVVEALEAARDEGK